MAPARPAHHPPSTNLLSHDKHRTSCVTARAETQGAHSLARCKHRAVLTSTLCPVPPHSSQLCDSHLYRKHIISQERFWGKLTPGRLFHPLLKESRRRHWGGSQGRGSTPLWGPTRRNRRMPWGMTHQAAQLAFVCLVTTWQPPDLSLGHPAQSPFCAGFSASPQ